MFPLTIPAPAGRCLEILCIGAHCDDIEIGCGGTLL
ncbi:MAG: PIG-L family deacetylase, partial [Gemmatimonadaceae bacterium]